MEMVQGYAYLLADHLAQWVQPMTAMPAKPQLVAIRGDAGTVWIYATDVAKYTILVSFTEFFDQFSGGDGRFRRPL